MGLSDDISKDIQKSIDSPWKLRKGQVVPSTTDVALDGGAVELDATFLYADLADLGIGSSKIIPGEGYKGRSGCGASYRC